MSDNGASIDFLDTLDRFGGWKTILAGADAWVQYNSVDFGKRSLQKAILRVKAPDGGELQLHTDARDGPVTAGAVIPRGADGWQVVTAPLPRFTAGLHNIFLVSKDARRVEVDWVRFE